VRVCVCVCVCVVECRWVTVDDRGCQTSTILTTLPADMLSKKVIKVCRVINICHAYIAVIFQ